MLKWFCLSELGWSSQVTMASQLSLDAWFGARDWALEHPAAGGAEGWISRQDYEEKGGEYLSEHCASNAFIPMRITKPVPSRPAEPSLASQTPTGAAAGVAAVTLAPAPPSSVVSTDITMVASWRELFDPSPWRDWCLLKSRRHFRLKRGVFRCKPVARSLRLKTLFFWFRGA